MKSTSNPGLATADTCDRWKELFYRRGIERYPPKAKVARSNRVGLARHDRGKVPLCVALNSAGANAWIHIEFRPGPLVRFLS